ncbi:MAG: glycoside hydrolase family 78 protein [Kiritimatiellaeota bacterium]|nr:glycoside hydrolase family 78 protein [Kiritimatiellota bacterium]
MASAGTVGVARAVGLVCEYRVNPVGIFEAVPRLSWRMEDGRPGARQKAYQIVAAASPEALEAGEWLWDTRKVASDVTLDVPYGGAALQSRQRVWWRVRLWDAEGTASAWSEAAFFETGLLKKTDWTAQWIGAAGDRKKKDLPSPYLRKVFKVTGTPVNGRLHVSALGIFECFINGQRIGTDVFAPGWTDYRERVQVVTYDVTGLLKAGENVIAATLADGWYAGHIGWGDQRCLHGDQLALMAQLEMETADGDAETVVTDTQWKVSLEGPVRLADFYNGETYDARKEFTGWELPTFDDRAWKKASIVPSPRAALCDRLEDGVGVRQELSPKAYTQPVPGSHIYDMGQNMVGWARIAVTAPAGTVVTIRFAEMLQADGTMYTVNYRSARSTDVYICKGNAREIYQPRFTFHGFRYVEITGDLSTVPTLEDVTGVVLHSDIPEAGKYAFSDPLAQQLQSNIVWGQRGNYLEVPTDCPQRDERLGWTGDAQVFIPTACYNRNVAAFFAKWFRDMRDAQKKNGAIPRVIPDVLRDSDGGDSAWADAAIICPWVAYLHYGDRRILESQYDTMAGWVAWQDIKSKDGILNVATFGDWLTTGNPPPGALISTAYFARCAALMAEIARILKKSDDVKKYTTLFKTVRDAFNREFVTPNGRIVGDTQTAYLLALAFDLLKTEAQRQSALDRLVADIEGRGNKLATGFVGTPLLAPVLTRFGRIDIAYRLFHQTEYPSWNYPILQGATTMWERWNSYTKEHGFGDASMNSFNHYAYGAIGEWMYGSVIGIAPDPKNPGFKHILIQPQPGGTLTSAKGSLMTRHGLVACDWHIADADGAKTLAVTVTVPPNTTATLALPGKAPVTLSPGTHAF